MRYLIIAIGLIIYTHELNAATEMDFYASFGFLRANYADSDVHLNQADYDRKITYESLDGHDDMRAYKLNGYHVTNLQYYTRIGWFYDTNYAIEFGIAHFTYDNDINQKLRRHGKWDGALVDEVDTFGNNFKEWEHSNGINNGYIAVGQQYEILTSGDFAIKSFFRIGAGLAIINSNSEIVNPDGQIDKYISDDLKLGGFSLLASKALRVSYRHYFLEPAIEITGIRLQRVEVVNGYAKQDILSLTGTLQIGRAF
ncbi:MAG: hypothetical protein AB8G05_15825 [Oligoflexales bacterium]